jgi:hypothetical protein
LTLEWSARPSLFNEPRPTQVDVYAENLKSIILFECKFTEQDGGVCSQTEKRNGSIPCTGNYGGFTQSPPSCPPDVNGNPSSHRCALTRKKILYWDIIPKVFHLNAHIDYQPCPFAGPTYQWMRNLVVAYKVARQKNKQPAVVIVYADSSGLPMAKKVKSQGWRDFTSTVRQDQVPLHVRSYQEIISLAQSTIKHGNGDQHLWKDLAEWVKRKITAVKAEQRPLKRTRFCQANAKLASRSKGRR